VSQDRGIHSHARASDDVTFEQDREVVYATSATVNGQYSYQGILKNASGQSASHSDMSAYADDTGAYFVTRAAGSIRWPTTVIAGCLANSTQLSMEPRRRRSAHCVQGWQHLLLDRVLQDRMAVQQQLLLHRTGHDRPWTYQGFIAPVTDTSNDISLQRTWLSQTTWVQPVVGSKGRSMVLGRSLGQLRGHQWRGCGQLLDDVCIPAIGP